MKQQDLFSAVTNAPPIVAVEEPAHLYQRAEDGRGITLASYARQTECDPYPGLWTGVHVELGEYRGAKVPEYLADCHMELPDRSGQWNVTRRFKSRNDAATECALFGLEAERLLARYAAGERGISLPGWKQWAAAVAYAENCGEAVKLRASIARLEADLYATDDYGAKRLIQSELHDASSALHLFVEGDAVFPGEARGFCNVHHWSLFT